MTLRSMTAFGIAETSSEAVSFRCQIKTLNSRYLEVSVRLPRTFQAYEADITALIKRHLERGKVDVSIHASEDTNLADLPQVNAAVAAHYVVIYRKLEKLLSEHAAPATQSWKLSPSDLMRLDGVLEQPKADATTTESPHKAALFACVEQALETIKAERQREGAALQQALADLIKDLDNDRAFLQKRAASLLQDIYSNYLKRLDGLLKKMHEANLPSASDLNKDRLHLEIGILTDKCDIDEELTRMKTHCNEFAACFRSDEAVGRKLDFLCQEMHREVNTMSNKLVQSEASQTTIRMKLTIERIRQQVQNIE